MNLFHELGGGGLSEARSERLSIPISVNLSYLTLPFPNRGNGTDTILLPICTIVRAIIVDPRGCTSCIFQHFTLCISL